MIDWWMAFVFFWFAISTMFGMKAQYDGDWSPAHYVLLVFFWPVTLLLIVVVFFVLALMALPIYVMKKREDERE